MTRADWVRVYGGPSTVVLPPGGYYEIRCFRCDERMQLEIGAAFFKACGKAHSRCRMTLLGARWELLQALYRQKWRLEHP
jgi:hypothetical protein